MSAIFILLPIFGFAIFFRRFLKKTPSFCIFLAITSIISVEFVFGLLNLLKYGSFALFYGGAGLMLYMFLKHKKEVYEFFSSLSVVVYVGVSIFYLYSMQGAEFFFWDEYSHWGAFIKEMFYFDRFYDATSVAAHLNYPPGASLWDYFLVSNLFFSETNIYFAYFLFLFSSTLMMYENLKAKDIHWVVLIFVIQMSLFASFGHWFSSIYVDHLIGAMFAGLIFSYLSDEFRLKELWLFTPLLVSIVLVKEIGLYFGIAFLGFVFFYEILKAKLNKAELLKLFGVLLGLLLVMVLALKVWGYRQESVGVQKEHQSISGIAKSLFLDEKVLDEKTQKEVKKRFWEVVNYQQIHKEKISLNYNEFSYSLMPRYTKEIKFTTSGIMLFYLALMIVLLVVVKDKDSRLKIAFSYIYMLLISIIYLFILYFSFLVAFGDGALRVPSFVRYMNMAILPMMFVGFFVMMPVMRLHSKKLFATACVLAIAMLFVVQPYYKPLYSQMQNPMRKDIDKVSTNIVKNTTLGSKIFVVFAGSNRGSIANMLRYSLIPLKTKICNKNFKEKSSKEMLKEYLKYDYIWFISLDRAMVEKNRFILKPKQPKGIFTLYKVKKVDAEVEFVPVI
jgi:cytochrome bd-type quinol oxidase subunit 2